MMAFAIGTRVIRKADGARGTVTDNDGREIVVRYDATGELKTSPWGKYKDAGSEGHVRVEHAGRIIQRAEAVAS